MTVAEIGTAVKDYLHIASSHDASDLIVVDRLVLQALNHARVWAERENDFALSLVSGLLSVAPTTGGSLDSVTTDIGTVSIRSIVSAYLSQAGGGLLPLSVRPRRTFASLMLKANTKTTRQIDEPWPLQQFDVTSTFTELHTLGSQVFLHPSPTTATTITVEGYKWLNAYVALDSATDFLTEYGSDFMMWFAICEVNHRMKIFVPRQEGSLAPPEEARDAAWASLLKWDGYMHEEGREHNLGY